MKPLPTSDFRAKRFMLEDSDFAESPGKYAGPTNLIQEDTWKSLTSLPDDVSIRTSDTYGSQLEQMWEYWGIWGRVVLAVQAFSRDPSQSPTAAASRDATDEFQSATYCALVGFYRVAFSCLRNVLEQMTIGTRLAIVTERKSFDDWRNGDDRIGFRWAADTVMASPNVRALEHHLKKSTGDSLFSQNPKGVGRRLFAQFSKYTHGAAGFTDADSRESNGPIFVPQAFLGWCVAALKTYAIALCELRLSHLQLNDLPYGLPSMTLNEFCRRVVADIPSNDKDSHFFRSLADFLD
jgi:hypothetical protein